MDALIGRREIATDEIRFAFGSCSLGIVLVAVSDKGVVAILMGDDEQSLRRDLANAFPRARRSADQAGLADIIATVSSFLETPAKGLDLALDIRGSVRERAVWQALCAVPPGKTTTYGRIAKALTLPATAQDVGAACAANVLAVAIPCHRVVKTDGSISGYRWGVLRKRTLINREAAA